VVLRNNEENRDTEYTPPPLRRILVVIVLSLSLSLSLSRVSKGLVVYGVLYGGICSNKREKKTAIFASAQKKNLACDLMLYILLLLS
jgi:hypothetical protein